MTILYREMRLEKILRKNNPDTSHLTTQRNSFKLM